MSYAITGLAPSSFSDLFTLSDADLAARNAMRVEVTAHPGFPCRISLEDAAIGETVILLHHVSHDAPTPYRSAYAIYVRDVGAAADFSDSLPPVMRGRALGLRAFDAKGMLRDARLAAPGQADAAIRGLFDNPAIAYIHAHNAAHGCFVAQVDRA
jgi:hypothetical protein